MFKSWMIFLVIHATAQHGYDRQQLLVDNAKIIIEAKNFYELEMTASDSSMKWHIETAFQITGFCQKLQNDTLNAI